MSLDEVWKKVRSESEWGKYLEDVGYSDIYFSAEYHQSFASSLQRIPELFVYRDGKNLFVYPYMLGEINADLYDIETVYGYSGPLSNSDDEEFLKEAWKCFYASCTESNIVCEIIKFSPLLNNSILKSTETKLEFNRKTISIDLSNSIESSYHPKLRNDIRKAEKMNIQLSDDKANMAEFQRIYNDRMKAINATNFYLFKNEHYNFLKESESVTLITAKHNGSIIAGAVMLLSKPFVHYHLAANTGDNVSALASKLIIHRAANKFKDLGYKFLHLGGGRSVKEDDSLLFFKKRFGTTINNFYIGKTIILSEKYDKLCKDWEQHSGKRVDGSYFQVYRLT